ncbi:MAG: prenyltransferase/squalene oxidase repeat-containing protein [Planctomycetota bacterium]
MRSIFNWLVAGAAAIGTHAQDAPTFDERAEAFTGAAIEYLREQQDASGGWAVNPDGPNFPAITGLVVTGMLLDPAIDTTDADVADAIGFILSYRQPDGGIYDRLLASYNTAICVSALALAREELPEADATIEPAVSFLRELQWGSTAGVPAALGDEVASVPKSHPFYGGVGYGGSGRPDNSNLSLWMQAMEDAGVPGDDPAVQRALTFLERTQMLGSVNDMPYAEGSTQGGFIYATSPSGDEADLGIGESKAGEIEETLSDGTRASRLRAYGSMTYAGFKSYAYAELSPTDPRVLAAMEWIARNYGFDENPGIGTDGYYYFLMTAGRALEATGSPTVDVITEDMVARADWPSDLIDRLLEMQQADGSLRVVDDRWMEDNAVLITAYGLIAAQHARMAHTATQETDNR